MGALFRKWFVPHKGNDHTPHFLRLETLSAVLVFVVFIQIGFLGHLFLIYANPGFTASVLPSLLVDITNQDRIQNQAAPVAVNSLLQKAAQEKADDMAAKGYFSHDTPEGYAPWHWLDQVGYPYLYAGENLAVNFFDSSDVATAWMNSPEHRANVVKPQYTQIGIAMAEGNYQGHPTIFVVEFFGTPKPAPAPVAALPLPAAAAPAASTASASVSAASSASKAAPAAPVAAVPKIPAPQPAVLGAESQNQPIPVIPVSVQPTVQPVQTVSLPPAAQVAAAPRAFNAALLQILLWITLLATAVLAAAYSRNHHKRLIFNGAALAAVIAALLFFNTRVLPSFGQLPSGSESASVSQALP